MNTYFKKKVGPRNTELLHMILLPTMLGHRRSKIAYGRELMKSVNQLSGKWPSKRYNHVTSESRTLCATLFGWESEIQQVC